MDFTLSKYKKVLENLLRAGFSVQTFEQFLTNPLPKTIVLRHDVDLLPHNSLVTARIENELGICASYYFRAVSQSWNEEIIKEIKALGHEIGYHYESLTTCNGNHHKAIDDFKHNLAQLRELASVKTICMHGSPMSKYDSRDLWKNYDYKDFGIIGEPYFDVDFSIVLYLTDTGRRWDGDKVSVRDKPLPAAGLRYPVSNFNSTNDIIRAANEGRLANQIMISTHPQRWTNNPIAWTKELVLQNVKNVVKRVLVKRRKE